MRRRPQRRQTGPTLQTRLERLQDLDGSALREEWRRLCRSEPPRISRDLLMRALAYRLQELEFGGLPRWARQSLAEPAAGADPPAGVGALRRAPHRFAEARRAACSGMAWPNPCGRRSRRCLRVRGAALSLPDPDRTRDHRRALVGPEVLRAGEAKEGGRIERSRPRIRREWAAPAGLAPPVPDCGDRPPSGLADVDAVGARRARTSGARRAPMAERNGGPRRRSPPCEGGFWQPARRPRPLRDLHPQVLRGRAGAGVQLPRCPARGLRGLYPQPEAARAGARSPTRYDDGGFSGGNMERPALKRLLADIDAGRIDIVVVYKVDRLTRSLADFAKIVEVVRRAGRLLRLGHPGVQHHHHHGAADAERAAVLRPVRARGHRRAHPRQDRRLQEARACGWAASLPLGYDVEGPQARRQRGRRPRRSARSSAATSSSARFADLKAELDAEGVVSKRRIAAGGSD